MSVQRMVKDSSVIDMMVELHHFSDEIHTPLCLPWLTF
jgi:hypothetical protein